MTNDSAIRWFADTTIDDVPIVGGKNASLGEMYRELSGAGVQVPDGFATTAAAFRRFLDHNGLREPIAGLLADRDRADVDELTEVGRRIRTMILSATLTDELVDGITGAYRRLSEEAGIDADDGVEVAVRSSATAEDLPEASFAGQQESFLMVQGRAAVLEAVKRCFASLYNARAINYRHDFGIDETGVALSAGVQRMVRADQASSGVIFTLDTDSGHRGVVYVTASWGLGENIVQGRVDPDAFHVHKQRLHEGFAPLVGKRLGAKELRMRFDEEAARVVNERTPDEDRVRFSLSEDEVLTLARWAVAIEEHYSDRHGIETPMDVEWAKDGRTGELFVVQARPETVHSQRGASSVMEVHHLEQRGTVRAQGLAVGDRIASGVTRVVADPENMAALRPGEVLVTETTDPDWEPILKRAAAVVTERGGRTSHAAIVARELGIPAIVGVRDARRVLGSGATVTVCCAEGETGYIYEGLLPHRVEEIDLASVPELRTRVMVNLGDPGSAYRTAMLPVDGVGLARMEFIIASHVRVHPLALLQPERLTPEDRAEVERLTAGYDDPSEYLVERVALGVGTLAAAFWPRPVIVRFSDFKTNEYAGLVGGSGFEPTEENPMLGWRGASRYYHPGYREGFELEVAAIRRVRERFGLTNLKVMIPFCRTPDEGRRVIEVMEAGGLRQGVDGLEVYVMTELPANVWQADEFAEVFDGFSIGSNDLTQLTLGVDRDSDLVAELFDERDPSVLRACAAAIEAARRHGRPIGICGQAPSDYPEFARFLVEQGIDSISVTPDAAIRTIGTVRDVEYRAAVGRLVEAIDRDGDGQPTEELRRAALDELARPAVPGGEAMEIGTRVADEEDGDRRNPAEFLLDALHRFETDHPLLTKAVNDVSHYLSGMGI